MTRFRPACFALFATLSVSAAHAHAERRPQRHFDLVNASHDRVVALAVSPVTQGVFEDVEIGAPLHGGRNAMTFRMPDGGCLRDLRVTTGDGRNLLYPRIDVCRYRGLTVTPRDGKAPRTDRALAHDGANASSPDEVLAEPN
jgi:hypothetical protein